MLYSVISPGQALQAVCRRVSIAHTAVRHTFLYCDGPVLQADFLRILLQVCTCSLQSKQRTQRLTSLNIKSLGSHPLPPLLPRRQPGCGWRARGSAAQDSQGEPLHNEPPRRSAVRHTSQRLITFFRPPLLDGTWKVRT